MVEKKTKTKTVRKLIGEWKEVEEHTDFWVTPDGKEFDHQETAEKWERVLSIPHKNFNGGPWYYFRSSEDYEALILYHAGKPVRNHWSISKDPGVGWHHMDLQDWDDSDYPSYHLILTPKAEVLAEVTKKLNELQSLPEVVQ